MAIPKFKQKLREQLQEDVKDLSDELQVILYD
jgi:hypothetical protein